MRVIDILEQRDKKTDLTANTQNPFKRIKSKNTNTDGFLSFATIY